MMTTKPTRDDFVRAMEEMDSYLDVSPEDLMILNEKATRHARLRGLRDIPVERFMTRELVTITPQASVSEAAVTMLRQHVAGLPVVGKEGELAGVFTEADLLAGLGLPHHQAHHSIWQTLESIFSPHAEVNAPSGSVGEVMVRDVVTLGEGATLGEVIEAMRRHRIKRVIVTDGQRRPVGIVTRSNLIRIFLETLAEADQP
jgi:CBS domain-containing protein